MQRYQEELEEQLKISVFAFDSVDVLYYNLNKISLNRVGSYIGSLKWIKNKKETINPEKNDDKCFQYAVIVALKYENIKRKFRKDIRY